MATRPPFFGPTGQVLIAAGLVALAAGALAAWFSHGGNG